LPSATLLRRNANRDDFTARRSDGFWLTDVVFADPMLSLLVGTGARSATRVERRTVVVVLFGEIFIESNQFEQQTVYLVQSKRSDWNTLETTRLTWAPIVTEF